MILLLNIQNINDFIQQKLIQKCDREEISIDVVSLEAKTFFTNQACYISKSAYAISRHMLRVIRFIKKSLVYVNQKRALAQVY